MHAYIVGPKAASGPHPTDIQGDILAGHKLSVGRRIHPKSTTLTELNCSYQDMNPATGYSLSFLTHMRGTSIWEGLVLSCVSGLGQSSRPRYERRNISTFLTAAAHALMLRSHSLYVLALNFVLTRLHFLSHSCECEYGECWRLNSGPGPPSLFWILSPSRQCVGTINKWRHNFEWVFDTPSLSSLNVPISDPSLKV